MRADRWRRRALDVSLILPLWLVGAGWATAQAGPKALPPALADSPCPTGALVDPVFRDAALQALAGLVVKAPGRSVHGAVRSHQSAGHVDAQGRAWHQISAYQVNLGLVGALRMGPQQLPLVADWLG